MSKQTPWMFSLLAAGCFLAGCPTSSSNGPDPETDAGTTEPDADPETDGGTDGPDVDPETDGGTDEPAVAPDDYNFESRFGDGSSVSYSGQTNRHALIRGLKNYIGNINDTTFQAGQTADDVKAALRYFTDYKNQGGDGSDAVPYNFTDVSGAAVDAAQGTYGDIGSPASLEEKLPDIDVEFGTARWSNGYGVIGYSDNTLLPSAVLDSMLTELATMIAARADGTIETDPEGVQIQKTYVSGAGVDYQQLIQKFLDGAVTYSQGTDDYMDDDLEGKGLLSDNVNQVEKNGSLKSYTALEHVWDEGFGYFGAARDYDTYTDDEIAAKGGRDEYAKGFFDSDNDGEIDLKSELNQGHSVNAAKRDRGAMIATDYTQQAFDAFVAGRHLIATAGELDTEELNDLRDYRDTAHDAWEKAIAATVVHYINDVLQDMANFDTYDYNFAAHAKHWSEAKGFALSLQFNPRAALDRTQLQRLHDALGVSPVLPNAEAQVISDYKDGLNDAKTLLQAAYSFDADNMGDANGFNGW